MGVHATHVDQGTAHLFGLSAGGVAITVSVAVTVSVRTKRVCLDEFLSHAYMLCDRVCVCVVGQCVNESRIMCVVCNDGETYT